jgi:transcriptional antiterminator RfaH
MGAMPLHNRLDSLGATLAGVARALPGRNPAECGSHSTRSWYCVQAERGREAEVRDRLLDQGFGAFLPLVIAMRSVKPGVMKAAAVPAFPGYLFTAFDLRADQWRSICYTRGVRSLFCTSPEHPTSVPRRQIEALLALGYDRPIVEDPRPRLIEAGAQVKVTAGPFADTEGVCLLDDGKRVRMLMDLLGGPREVAVPRASVIKTA